MNLFIWSHILGLAVGFGAGWWAHSVQVGHGDAVSDDPIDAAVRGD